MVGLGVGGSGRLGGRGETRSEGLLTVSSHYSCMIDLTQDSRVMLP